MILTFDGDVFIAKVSFEERHLAKRAGFKFSDGVWASPDPNVAARLRSHADERGEEKLRSLFIEALPWSGRIPLPKGKSLDDSLQQTEAVRWFLSRNRSYLALDPGQGKTVVCIAGLNALGPHPVVVVSKPSLCAHWRSYVNEWSTWPALAKEKVLIIPDSLIDDPLGRHPYFDNLRTLTELGNATLILEEAHRFKSHDAARTRAILGNKGIHALFDRVVLLSGSPAPNRRPLELYPALSALAPETIGFRNLARFGYRYCGAVLDRFGHLDLSGASNTDELMAAVRAKFMLRLKKKLSVDKTFEVIILGQRPTKVTKLDRELLGSYYKSDLMRGKLTKRKKDGEAIALPVATYRRLLGVTKVPLVVSFVRELLEDPAESMILFAEHIEVVEKLAAGLKRFQPIVLTAKTKNRQEMVDLFQKSARHRLFISNGKIGGEGFTLTKSRRVGLVEPPWVPGDIEQFSDRAFRRGQKRDVVVSCFVFEDSLDGSIIKQNLRKNENTQLT